MGLQRYSQLGQSFTLSDGTPFTFGLPYLNFMYTGKVVWHTVQAHEVGRLDRIAYGYPQLADPRFWPFIAWMNKIRDPFREVYAGRELIIPISPISILKMIDAYTYMGQ